jgi:hypothetical protein
VGDGHFDDGAEVLVPPFGTDVAGIDAVLGQGGGAARELGEEQVAVVVEVADDRDRDALGGENMLAKWASVGERREIADTKASEDGEQDCGSIGNSKRPCTGAGDKTNEREC